MKTIASALLLAVMAATTFAADLPVPKAKQERIAPAKEPTDFDKLAADCIEATDGCRRYTRANDGKFDAANNIGIACQPKALVCSKRR